MRPGLLDRNIESARAQTVGPIQHLFVVDRHKVGIAKANMLFHQTRGWVAGDYVYVLDDDNALYADDVWSIARAAIESTGHPEVLIVKGHRPGGSVFPSRAAWDSKTLVRGSTNAHCYIVRHDVWKRYIVHFGDPPTHSGAWQFPKAMIDGGVRFEWCDVIVGQSLQLGRGRIEQMEPDWWETYVLPRYPAMMHIEQEVYNLWYGL